MHVNPKGRNWGLLVNWDDLGKLYTAIIIAWSLVLFSGIGWLLWNRRLPFVRIRSLPLTITSTLFLHLYLLKIFMAYTTNGHFTCGAEFWIMSIYLPFGIALWQINCTQLRSIAERQERLLTRQLSFNRTLALPGTRARDWWTRWKSLSQAQKSYFFVAIGLVVQFLVTAILYATSPELQGDWSSYGNIPFNKGQAKCRKSLVWIPSAFWQLFWTWIYGPYELYKIRHIRDSHRWRLQTLLCIVSGLPGSPLWLAAVFTNGTFKPVNPWFVPPMWLAPGIIVMQFANIFFPIFETIEYGKAMRKTIHSIGSESTLRGSITNIEKQHDMPDPADESANKLFDELNSSYQGRSLYSITALERALLINPSPLLHYAATKDFTAENIIFLTEINCWRDAWKAAPKDLNTGLITEVARTRLFEMAVEIFITSVYEKTAEFPVNIEGFLRRELIEVFEAAVPEGQRPSGESGRVRRPSAMFGIIPTQNGIDLNNMANCSATLWDDQKKVTTATISSSPPSTPPSPDAVSCEFSSNATTPDVSREDEQPFAFESHPSISPLGAGRAKIREGFDEHVFDAAEASIKYLVLTNTWRKFVQLREREQMLAQDV